MTPVCEKLTAPPSSLSVGALSRDTTIVSSLNPSASSSDLPVTQAMSSDKSSSGDDLKAPLLSSTLSDVPISQTLSSSIDGKENAENSRGKLFVDPDPDCLRCLPQIHGSIKATINHCIQSLEGHNHIVTSLNLFQNKKILFSGS